MLSENIKAGTDQEDVKARLLQVLGPTEDTESTESQAASMSPDIDAQLDESSERGVSNGAAPTNSARVEEPSEITSRSKGKQRATSDSAEKGDDTDLAGASKKQRESWVHEQKKRKQEAQAERKRILAQIESDKKERKQKEQDRKAAAAAANAEEQAITTDESPKSPAKAGAPPRTRYAKDCALKIRTFDGSTVASKFPSEQTLREHVRPWIESELGKPDAPYEFTQVLAPMPNRRISVSEEEESLQSLGLAPSATLVMVPIKAYTEAYTSSGAQGYLSSGLSYGYGVVKSGVSLIGGLAGSFLGGSGEASAAQGPTQSPHGIDGSSEAPRSSINVRTLRDRAVARDDQQLYNGNTLNFEPRREDDEKEE